MSSLLLTVLWSLQDPGMAELTEQLGDPSPEIRARATELLEDRGSEALPALLRARNHADAEIRTRAREILLHLNPTLLLDELIRAQRPSRMGAPGPEVASCENPVTIDGGTFYFQRRRWPLKSPMPSTILVTHWEQCMDGNVPWTVVSVTAGCEVAVERCTRHSPRLLLVPADCTDPVVLTLRGLRTWTCEVPISFRKPAPGDVRRIGPCTVTVDRTSLAITTPRWAAWKHGPLTALGEQFRVRLRSGRLLAAPSTLPMVASTDEPAIFFPEAREQPENLEWCSCPVGRKTNDADEREGTASRVDFRNVPWKDIPLEEIAAIEFSFPFPVEEPFEVTSPPLK